MIYLKKWSVGCTLYSPFLAPERASYVLEGLVFGHPKFADGKSITTSQIVKVDGKIVNTASGSEYIVEGPPSEAYLDFLKKCRIPFKENDPLNFKK